MNQFSEFSIKPASTSDVDILQELCTITFSETYKNYNTEEDMQLYINEHFNRKNLLEELENEKNFFFLATLNRKLFGYIKLRTNNELSQLKNKKNIELERIYVVEHFQGLGLGNRLIHFAVDFARNKSYDTIWLGVWKKNEKAITFYKKCGFEIFGEHTFTLGTDEQVDWLMKKDLTN